MKFVQRASLQQKNALQTNRTSQSFAMIGKELWWALLNCKQFLEATYTHYLIPCLVSLNTALCTPSFLYTHDHTHISLHPLPSLTTTHHSLSHLSEEWFSWWLNSPRKMSLTLIVGPSSSALGKGLSSFSVDKHKKRVNITNQHHLEEPHPPSSSSPKYSLPYSSTNHPHMCRNKLAVLTKIACTGYVLGPHST